jgi:hypothetical protein
VRPKPLWATPKVLCEQAHAGIDVLWHGIGKRLYKIADRANIVVSPVKEDARFMAAPTPISKSAHCLLECVAEISGNWVSDRGL